MKPGRRALGIATSDRDQLSHLAGAVVRADRVVDGFEFGTCTVGGSDATAAVCDMFDRLGREDDDSGEVARPVAVRRRDAECASPRFHVFFVSSSFMSSSRSSSSSFDAVNSNSTSP